MTRSARWGAYLLALAPMLAACGGSPAGGGSGAPTTPEVEMPTASFRPPPTYETSPANRITLSNVQPDDGPGPVAKFIRSARKSIDVSIYAIDSDFTAIVDPLVAQERKGIPVRVSISRQRVGMPNPPNGNSEQLATAQQLQAKGLQVELSRPELHYGHEKAIIIDAGTPRARAMVADWNLQSSYFGASQYGPVGARGMAVVDTDPDDVASIAAYFDANWPPYKRWPVNERASLVWSPSGDEYAPVGNGVEALTDFIAKADKSLDVYAEYIQDDSFLIGRIMDRARAGVKVRVVANSGGQSPQMVAQLRAAGADVRFDPTTPAHPKTPMFVHSKTMVADAGRDDAVAFVGSQNEFINESLEAILELGALVTDRPSLRRIGRVFDTDFSRSSTKQAPPSSSPASSGSGAASTSANPSPSPS